MGNLPANERYTYKSMGTWEVVGEVLVFAWGQTAGSINLTSRTLNYGDVSPAPRYKLQMYASMNDIRQAVQEANGAHDFQQHILQFFAGKKSAAIHKDMVDFNYPNYMRSQGLM